MKHSEFIFKIEEYYGKYDNKTVWSIMLEYLKRKFTEEQLNELLNRTIVRYSNQYKRPPDVAYFETLSNTNNIRAEKAWSYLINKSSSDDVLITDKVLYNTVKCWGTWDAFCQARDGDYREVTHRDFVKRFLMFSESRNLENPEVLKGACSLLYGDLVSVGGVIGKRTPAIIGNAEEGKKLLSANKKSDNNLISGFLKNVDDI